MIKMTRWRSCINTPPKKDGDYLVVRFRKDGTLIYAAAIHFTVKYGWNTYLDEHNYTMFFDENNKYDRACLWTEMTKQKGRR